MKCRHCNSERVHPFINLGSAPPSNAYLTETSLHQPEKWFPLNIKVCEKCWLVQTEDFLGADEIFTKNYAYFSSFSSSWVKHAQDYVDMIVEQFNFNRTSRIVEIASNDGYLLQFFKEKTIPCYGVEPAHDAAAEAAKKGIEVVEAFFNCKKALELYQDGQSVDLMIANNVLAHVPDINDFLKGFAILLKPEGIATFEFPHLLNLVNQKQFDTVYHEHFSYFSLLAAEKIFRYNGLTIFKVEEIKTHGGSLRVYAERSDTGTYEIHDSVRHLRETEEDAGMNTLGFYENFQRTAEYVKMQFLKFIVESKEQNLSIAAYGAAAKGNTLLNFAGIRSDSIEYVVDRNPVKQKKYMPGSRIPIVSEPRIRETQPDYILILPWNIRKEICEQLSYVQEWGGRFVTVIPELQII